MCMCYTSMLTKGRARSAEEWARRMRMRLVLPHAITQTVSQRGGGAMAPNKKKKKCNAYAPTFPTSVGCFT